MSFTNNQKITKSSISNETNLEIKIGMKADSHQEIINK